MKRHAVKTVVRPRRVRYNISLGEDTRELAESLAREDVRSFSSMLEWLVQHEWRRRRTAPIIHGDAVWPELGTEAEIRAASRQDWVSKMKGKT